MGSGSSSAFSRASGSSSASSASVSAGGAEEREILLIGTGSSVQAFDVDSNRDLFYKDAPEAVTALAAGQWQIQQGGGAGGVAPGQARGSSMAPLTFAGGNCTLTGFDAVGGERVWGVTGDAVTAIALADLDGK